MYTLDDVKGFYIDFLPEKLTFRLKIKIFIDLLAGKKVRILYKRVDSGWVPEPMTYPSGRKPSKDEMAKAEKLQKEIEEKTKKAVTEAKKKTKKELKTQQERIERMVS